MIKTKDYILELKEAGLEHKQIADHLGVSIPMVSHYLHDGYNASLSVAINVYKMAGVALFPFAEEALKELSDEKA